MVVKTMSDVIIDTNMVYYLSLPNKSYTKRFKIDEFLKDGHTIGITIFTFLEILNKIFDKNKSINKEYKGCVLTYLENNCEFLLDNDIFEKSNYNHIFKKCRESYNKRKYYKNVCINSIKDHYVHFMSDFSLVTGILFLSIIYKLDNDKDEYVFERSRRIIHGLQAKIRTTTEEYFEKEFVKYLSSKNKQEQFFQSFEKIFIDIIKMCDFIYAGSKELHPGCKNYEKEFQELKNKKMSQSVHLKDYKQSFDDYKYKCFDKKFETLYSMLFPKHNDVDRENIIKCISKKFLQDLTFTYNDLIDWLNLLYVLELQEDKHLKYLSADRYFRNFISKYRDKYTDLYKFSIKYIEM